MLLVGVVKIRAGPDHLHVVERRPLRSQITTCDPSEPTSTHKFPVLPSQQLENRAADEALAELNRLSVISPNVQPAD